MRRRTLNLALSLAAGSAGLAGWRRASGQAPGWTPLFNGRDLQGWDRIGDANWRIEEGTLVADRGNGFLVSRESYGDFRLRAEFWVEANQLATPPHAPAGGLPGAAIGGGRGSQAHLSNEIPRRTMPGATKPLGGSRSAPIRR